MKKLIKKFLFWFVLMGVIVNVISITGSDDKNIILIGLNPLLNLLEKSHGEDEYHVRDRWDPRPPPPGPCRARPGGHRQRRC